MQISKALLIIWATLGSFVFLSLNLQAADNDAQSKAREALRKKMDELQPANGEAIAPAQVPSPAPEQPKQAVTPVKPSKKAAKPAPAPAVIPPPAAPEVVVTPPADSEAVAKAREALHKKMDELQGQPVPESPVSVNPPVTVKPRRTARIIPPPESQRPPAAPSAPPTVTPAPAPVVTQPRVPTPAPQQAVEANQPSSAQSATGSSPQNTAVPPERWEAEQAAQNQAKMKQKTVKSNRPSVPAFRPIEGPPVSISAEKQQRLSELLRRYQSDEITPSQYHEERAKILAQP